MNRTNRTSARPQVPNFALYGTAPLPAWAELVHCERIAERSRAHGWEIGTHRHDSLFQLLHLASGSGQAQLEGPPLTLAPGSLVLVPAGTVHSFRFAPEVEGTVVTVAQRPLEAALRLLAPARAVLPGAAQLRHSTGVSPALAPLLQEIEQEARSPGGEGAALALLAALLLRLARSGEAARDAIADTTLAAQTGHLQRFRQLLDERWRQQRQVQHYAAALGVASGHLGRLCRAALGQSALQVINARVLHEAQRELVYSTLPIKSVAAVLGFEDEAYFGRFFKKHTGRKPSEFRSAARQQMAQALDLRA